MRYLSLCSGIEAASAAWKTLGWEAVAFSEIERFPGAVLAHHYPDVPNLGDMTRIDGTRFRGNVDIVVGGTPCVAFSIAGVRKGLEDPRGNLTLTFVRLVNEIDPAFTVWENVPGVLSDRGNAFGCFLAGLAGEKTPLRPPGGKWTDAGYVLGPVRAVCWRILDAQYFGLAQRRRRVFVVACPREGADPRQILFEFEGLRRDSRPGEKTRQDIAGTLKGGSGKRGWDLSAEGTYIPIRKSHWDGGPHPTLSQSSCKGGIGMSDQELFGQGGAGLVPGYNDDEIYAIHPHCIGRGPGSGPQGKEYLADGSAYTMDTKSPQAVIYRICSAENDSMKSGSPSSGSSKGQGDNTLVQPIPISTQNALGEHSSLGIGEPGDPAFTLLAGHSHAVCAPLTTSPYADNRSQESRLITETVILDDQGGDRMSVHSDDICPTLRAQSKGHEPCVISFHGSQDPSISGQVTNALGRNRGLEGCVAIRQDQPDGIRTSNDMGTPSTNGNTGRRDTVHEVGMCVRRLMPVECERLMGFPDRYTDVLYAGSPAADGHRYKVLGNSMPVPVMHWIGKRIAEYMSTSTVAPAG